MCDACGQVVPEQCIRLPWARGDQHSRVAVALIPVADLPQSCGLVEPFELLTARAGAPRPRVGETEQRPSHVHQLRRAGTGLVPPGPACVVRDIQARSEQVADPIGYEQDLGRTT